MNYYKRHLGDFAKDTAHLSALEIGIYDLLLDRYYSTERPILDGETSKVARAKTAQDRATVKAVLSEFFKHKDGKWHHSYADRVIAKAREKAQQNRDIGKLGGRPKKTQTVSGDNPNGFQTETQTVSENNPIPLATNPLATKKKKDYGAVAPEPWIPQAVWSAFCEHRKSVRAPIKTDLTVKLIVDELHDWRAKGVEPDTVLNFAIKNGHRGLYYKPENTNGSQTNRRNPSLAERAAEAERVADETLGPL